MKRVTAFLVVFGVVLLFATGTCFAQQMYTITDLGTLGGTTSVAYGINNSGQVVGRSNIAGDTAIHGFRTAPSSPIDQNSDDLGTLGGSSSSALGINKSGQAVGYGNHATDHFNHAFRTAPNAAIDRTTDELDYGVNINSIAWSINALGQVTGRAVFLSGQFGVEEHAFRTSPNIPINPTTDDLGTLGGNMSYGSGINDSGQVVGTSNTIGTGFPHAFRTVANSPINPATDDLGTLGGTYSSASAINNFGQVVGFASLPGDATRHAFRTAPNSQINPTTDDLGTLGEYSIANGINAYGQVVGYSYLPGYVDVHAFVYGTDGIRDLNDLVPTHSGCLLVDAAGTNDRGQIAVNGHCGGEERALLLNPIYKAFVQQPINADGSSVFSAKRGTVPVKFRLTQYDQTTCNLLPATIAVVKAVEATVASVDESVYSTQSNSGSDFRITGCQYHYNLGAKELGVGVYRVDISINGIMVGHAVFALK